MPKANIKIHVPGEPQHDYPSPNEKVFGPKSNAPSTSGGGKMGPEARLHLNDMRNFQSEKGMRVHVTNPAGANVVVSSGMLGFTSGGYS